MRVLKILGVTAGVLLALAGVVWLQRDTLLLPLPGIIDGLRNPVGPHQPVAWQRGPTTAPAPPADRPPNIVVIVADDMGWNDITLNGGGVAGGTVSTPHIDSIARSGVSMSNGYSASGTCAPSRAAILSGRYPTRFGFEFTPTPGNMLRVVSRLTAGDPNRLRPPVTHFDTVPHDQLSFDQMGMPPSEVTIAELLRERGYHTVHIGKWHLGGTGGMGAHEQGFDESLLMASGLYLREDDPRSVSAKHDFDPIDRFLWANMKWAVSFNGGARFEPDAYLTDYFTDQAVEVIEANRNRPFLLYLAHWAPHTPLQALRDDYDALSHIEDHSLRVYAAMIRSLDRGVGRVLEALRENGLEENTLVIFTSDNGGANYIGLPEVNRPYRGWKITFFEGGIHVPFFLRWPAVLPAGRVYEEAVHHFDIYGTAAAAGGAVPPADRKVDGRDLVAFITGEESGRPHEALFWRSGHYQVVRAGGWKLQVADRPEKEWLYHLDEDPTEQANLAERHPEKVAELRRLLAAHNAEQVEPLWPALIEASVSIDKTLREPEAEDDEYIYWPN